MRARTVAGICLTVIVLVLLWQACSTRRPIEPVPVGNPTPAPEGDGWVDLLGADHAASWKNVTDDKDIFEIRNGMLHIYGDSIYPLRYVGYTGREFQDFDLHVEVRVEPGANSGIFLRANPEEPVQRGFEVQVLDDYGKAPSNTGSGAIYDVVTPMHNMARPAGQWNSYDIRVEGSLVEVVMNGWLVVKSDFSKMTEPIGKFATPYAELPGSGLIMLQDHGGEAWYRNVFVKPIETGDENDAGEGGEAAGA